MNQFESIFAGKKVAAVGPSSHLTGKGLGEKIDSYDLICRFNEVRPKGLEKDYGARVDVMFWHISCVEIKQFKMYAKSDLEGFNSAQLLVYPRQHGDVNRGWRGKSSTPEENVKKLPDIPFYQVDTEKVARWENKYNAHLNVGVLGLMMILETSFQELFVSGFSFYKTDNPYHHSHHWANSTRKKSHGVGEGIQALRDNTKGRQNVSGDNMFKETILKGN